MRPAENEGFQPNVIMSDRELAQATFAMRIFDHDVDISYSTREPASIRDHMATLASPQCRPRARPTPGGYYSYPQALEQFHVSDERTAVEVERALKRLGREPRMEGLGRIVRHDAPRNTPHVHDAILTPEDARRGWATRDSGSSARHVCSLWVWVVSARPWPCTLPRRGVGTIRLADDDSVSLDNLQRQILYTEADISSPKAECAARRLRAMNSDITIEAHVVRVDKDNIRSLAEGCDVVVDGCDNFATRYIVGDGYGRNGHSVCSTARYASSRVRPPSSTASHTAAHTVTCGPIRPPSRATPPPRALWARRPHSRPQCRHLRHSR